jgi:hypothetical protein
MWRTSGLGLTVTLTGLLFVCRAAATLRKAVALSTSNQKRFSISCTWASTIIDDALDQGMSCHFEQSFGVAAMGYVGTLLTAIIKQVLVQIFMLRLAGRD